MDPLKRKSLIGLMSAAAAVALPAQAKNFPAKTITFVVPYAAGGAPDLTARRLARGVSDVLGTPVVVENRTGAGATVGAAFVARAPKDGYTLLFGTSTIWAINPYLFKELPYTIDDFAPISLISKQPIVLNAALQLPPKSVPELIAYAKTRADGLTYGTSGSGSLTHIIGEWIGRSLKIRMVEVPYKGQSAANVDLLGGRLDMQLEGITSAAAMHHAGKTKVLAVLAEERSTLLPQVPTFAELGHPDLVAYSTFGVLAPAGTPAPVIAMLHKAITTVVNSPDFVGAVRANGEIPAPSPTPADYHAFTRQENERWGRIIKPMNLKLN